MNKLLLLRRLLVGALLVCFSLTAFCAAMMAVLPQVYFFRELHPYFGWSTIALVCVHVAQRWRVLLMHQTKAAGPATTTGHP